MILEIILGVLCIPPIAAIFSRKLSYVTNSIISSLIIILSLLMLLSVIKSSSFSMGYLSFSVDKLSAVFLFILGLVVLLDSIFSLYYVNTNRIIAFAYSLSIYSMMGVLISSNYLTLILFWEGMSIFGYLAIAYKKSSQAFPPFVFLAFGELSTLFLAVSFAGIYFYTGTLNIMEPFVGASPWAIGSHSTICRGRTEVLTHGMEACQSVINSVLLPIQTGIRS